MEHLPSGILEDILKRLTVRDLIRCKSVCKYWSSLISDPPFIRSHLNHSYLSDRNNADVGNRRIAISAFPNASMYRQYNIGGQFFDLNDRYLVGSCNGLVCISPCFNEVVIINPLTREVKKVPNPQIPKTKSLCWGFGYDSRKDDYKIVLGYRKGDSCTCFQMFSLRSKVWKVLGEIKYAYISTPGLLCKGMVHWVTYDILSRQKDVILSFNFLDEKFQEIPQPDVKYPLYFGRIRVSMCLGIMEDCLCLFYPSLQPRRVWVMKDYNNKESWVIVGHAYEIKHDVVHCIEHLMDYVPNVKSLCHETLNLIGRMCLRAPLFVESLISPHLQETEEEEASNEES